MTPSDFERHHAQRMQDYGAAMAANVAKVQTLADLAYLISDIFNDLDTMANEVPIDRKREYVNVLLARLGHATGRRYAQLTQPGTPHGPGR